MCDEQLSLSIYSHHREPGSTIQSARYIIDNGPLLVDSLAVSSATLFNTFPNVPKERQTLQWSAESVSDGSGEFEYKVPVGNYTGNTLAATLETGMLTQMAGTLTNNTLSVAYDSVTNRLNFTFDTNHDYTSIREYVYLPPLSYLSWNITGGGTFFRIISEGIYEVNAFAAALQSKMTTDLQTVYPGRSFVVTYDRITKKLTFAGDGGSPTIIWRMHKSSAGIVNRTIGMDDVDGPDAGSIIPPNAVQYKTINLVTNSPIEPILNFKIDGTVGVTSWTSGSLNLGGPLYLRFNSTKLADSNHRTVDNYHDTAFFTMPLTSGVNQMQHYQVENLTWIHYTGGIEVSEIDINMTDEHGHVLDFNNDYIIELRIKERNPF